MRQFETYQHYKGGVYLKIAEAIHSETDEVMVVYTSVFSGKVFVRPKDMFYEDVEIDGKAVPRFKKMPHTLDDKELRKSLPSF
jgi:hypothetical protein